jgi:P4 family phage/plasmid primase-like protien
VSAREAVVADFTALLLDTLGQADDEYTSLGYDDAAGVFHTAVMPPTDAVSCIGQLPPGANIYYSVNRVRGPARRNSGRGTETDVTRLTCLWVELDVKPGACLNLDVARAITATLSIILGTRPSVTVESGHGLHAYWPITDGHINDDFTTGHARALVRRFGRLAAVVADKLNVSVDSVFDIARMMRVPGTVNNKDPQNTVPVTAYEDTGGPLTIGEVDERLTEAGIYQLDGDDDTGREEVSPPSEWKWAEKTCAYVAKLIDGWATDSPKPGGGRNPWAYSQHIRLSCAHRLGCITQADHQRARQALADRHAHLVRTTEPRREPKNFEIADMIKHGIKRAASKTDDEARAELGGHTHTSEPVADNKANATFFDRDGLRVQDLANAVMDKTTCGYGTVDERFYNYDHGVWTPGQGGIEAAISGLLGNRYRGSHARNAFDVIRLSPRAPQISGDPVPRYINVRNGMIDWAAGTLVPHSPDHRSTVQLPVDYNPDAQCPQFEEFIAQVLPPDCYQSTEDSPGFIWEVLGYALYSGNPLHIAILLYGKGRNGKGTLIRILKRLLGDRNCATVGLHELAENRFRTATLFGKLANLAGDLDSRWLNNTATFKAITGGDSIQGEHKYGAVFDFQPWALPFYSANKAFGAADSSEGWVARWVVIPFPTSFIGREDRTLDTRLQSENELAGILRRAVEALPVLMARGRLPEPESVREAKRAFVAASDAVRSWLDEYCTVDPHAWTARTALYSAYRAHADEAGAKRLSAREFYSRIEQINGVWPATRRGERGFTGIALNGVQRVQEVQVDIPPPATRGKKGDKPAPSAPHTCRCGNEMVSPESISRGYCERCRLTGKAAS